VTHLIELIGTRQTCQAGPDPTTATVMLWYILSNVATILPGSTNDSVLNILDGNGYPQDQRQ
jgi:hypothetical protein